VQDAHAQPVLATFEVLFDEAAVLQRRHEPKCCRLVDTELAGQLGDARLAGMRQDLEHTDRPVDRLDGGGGRARSGPPVAHGETLVHLPVRPEGGGLVGPALG
jgi:hypothetical protein